MDNVSLLKNLYDAFGRGEIPTVLGAMSPDIHWHEAESNPYMPSGEAWVGPDAVLNNLFMKLGAEWDGFSAHPKSFHDAGDSIIVEARYSGTYKATGKSMDTQVCSVARTCGYLGSFFTTATPSASVTVHRVQSWSDNRQVSRSGSSEA